MLNRMARSMEQVVKGGMRIRLQFDDYMSKNDTAVKGLTSDKVKFSMG